ncbi:unnamed protein product [Cylindrotheca closterium]|uniref:Uncharacterized protein n=1 Tax=Cylindrotheca closterium TaxID=2856 RepID=A0AAD2FPH0_9STRA|nr:unnamed protein product [Cylindrotheca closterium]
MQETFLHLFQCGGLESTDPYESVTQQKKVFWEPRASSRGQRIGLSSRPSSPTSIYYIPSREKMIEIRQDSMNRSGRSGLFSRTTSSTPMRFSFEDYEYDMEEGANENENNSIRTFSIRTNGANQFSHPVKRVNSLSTVTTADSASVMEDLQQDEAHHIDIVAGRE